MSKELTPLEAFERIKNITYDRTDLYGIEEYRKSLDIIETALKDYEMEHTLRIRLENANYELVRENKENNKKLKAFEIIKEKKVKVGLFITLFITYAKDNSNYDDYIEAYQSGQHNAYYVTAESKKPLDKEEYELLKEVLI